MPALAPHLPVLLPTSRKSDRFLLQIAGTRFLDALGDYTPGFLAIFTFTPLPSKGRLVKFFYPIVALAFVTGCGGGGGGSNSVPPVYPIAGSYYGTVTSSNDSSGNMGLTTDALGNGNFAVQYPGEPVIEETFAPPVSSVSGDTLSVNGSIDDACTFSLSATMANANTLKGSYSLSCPGNATLSAKFSLPRGTYSISARAHHVTR